MSGRVLMRDIVAEVAVKHRLHVADITGKSRLPAIVRARHEAMFRCRSEAGKSLPQIGAFLCKDNTTVLYGVRRHREREAEAA